MEYIGKLYGKSGGEYFPLIETTKDVDNLKKRVSKLEAERQALNIADVSNRSGLLIAYELRHWKKPTKEIIRHIKLNVDKFLGNL